MTDHRELTELAASAQALGASVTIHRNLDGSISAISVAGANGIGPLPMPPIAAAERLRAFVSASTRPQKPGEAYKAQREALGLTQQQLADLLGVTRATINRRERLKSSISAEAMAALQALAKDASATK